MKAAAAAAPAASTPPPGIGAPPLRAHRDEQQAQHQQLTQSLSSFLLRNHHRHHRPIALVTSGGTACDLEINGVRCLENFSTGRRGAASVEQFLSRGYAVIHLWRRGSASPFARTFSESGLGLGRADHGIDVDCLGRLFACPHCHGEDDMRRGGRGRRGGAGGGGGAGDLCFCGATTIVSSDGGGGSAASLSASPTSRARRDDEGGDWFDLLRDEEEEEEGEDAAAAESEKRQRHQKLLDDYTTFQGGGNGNGGGIIGSLPPRLSSSVSSSIVVRRALSSRSDALREGTLLTVPFRTVEEYLVKLEVISRSLGESCGRTAVIYLAAAVSDFYVPEDEKSVHKIQSREVAASPAASSEEGDDEGCLVLKLKPVPKRISDLRGEWAPRAFVVSFKLETDPAMLERKARMAVEDYGVHLVVANILATRNDKVWMLSGAGEDATNTATGGGDGERDGGRRTGGGDMVELRRDDAHDPGLGGGGELEDLIVGHVAERHFEYLASAGPDGGGAAMGMGGAVGGAAGAAAAVVDHARRSRELVARRRGEIRVQLWRGRVVDLLLNVGGTVLGMCVSYWIGGALRRGIHRP